MLRAYIRSQGWYLPSSKQIKELVHQLYHAGLHAHCSFSTTQFRLFVSSHAMYIMPIDDYTKQPSCPITLSMAQSTYYFQCPNPCRVVIHWADIVKQYGQVTECEICFSRQSALSCMTPRQLKRLYQDSAVPEYMRGYVPLLRVDKRIVSVLDFEVLG